MATTLSEASINAQRRTWERRAASWGHAEHPGLATVAAAVLERAFEARPAPGLAVDLGCGSGQLSLPLAKASREVLAVDVSATMISELERTAASEGVGNVRGLTEPLELLKIDEGSADVIVSSYALHHLRDADKATLVTNAARWLAPGGVLVIGDMMLGRGGTARDRELIAGYVARWAKLGPAGWWRIAKNAGRYLLRWRERPITAERWQALLTAAGFVGVGSAPVVAEAGVVWGRRPD